MPSIAIKSEAEWLHFREHNVGGSEIASLFYQWLLPDHTQAIFHMFEPIPEGAVCLGCLGPYKTGYRLFEEKVGRVLPEDLTEVERVQAGKFLEPSIAAWSEFRWKWKLRKTRRYLTHDSVPGWGASLDYELEAKTWPPVEMKAVDWLVFKREWVADDKEPDVVLTPPLHINLQLQTQIGVTSAQTGWIVVVVGGNELKRGEIKRHEPTQARIESAIRAFWRAVHRNDVPERYADMDSVAEVYAVGIHLEEPIDLSDDPVLPQLCRGYKRWKRHADFVEQTLDNMKARIAGRMGQASRAAVAGWRITWPVIHRDEKMIPERLQRALDYRGGLIVSEDTGQKPRKRRK
jgi:predicted phage-related endonuclease